MLLLFLSFLAFLFLLQKSFVVGDDAVLDVVVVADYLLFVEADHLVFFDAFCVEGSVASDALEEDYGIPRYPALKAIMQRAPKLPMLIRIIILKQRIPFNTLRMVELIALRYRTLDQLTSLQKHKRIITQVHPHLLLLLLLGMISRNILRLFHAYLAGGFPSSAVDAVIVGVEFLLQLLLIPGHFLNGEVDFVLIESAYCSFFDKVFAFLMERSFAVFLAEV